MNTIIAVIVCYNSDSEQLAEQYDALKEQVDGIIYVDNGSIDNTFIEKNPDKATIIRNSSNIGLAAAQNQGIRTAFNKNATHILLLDDDSVPAEDMVSKLLNDEQKLLFAGYQVGLVGALTVNTYTGECNNKGIRFKGVKIKRIPIKGQPISVSFCIASGSLIRTEVLRKVGRINELLFIDNLDIEWCLRAKYCGYDIFASSSAVLNHRLGNGNKDKIKSHSPQREYYIIRNSIALAKMKHVPLGFKLRKIVLSILRICNSIVRGDKHYSHAGLKGLVDGFKLSYNIKQ